MSVVSFLGLTLSPEVLVAILGEFVVAGLLATAVVMAAIHHGKMHHYLILSAFLLDELVLKVLMYTRLSLGVFGQFPYSGTYAPVHITLAVTVTVLGLSAIVLGFRFVNKREGKMFMPNKGRKWHVPVGMLYVAMWFVAFLDGVYIFYRFYV